MHILLLGGTSLCQYTLDSLPNLCSVQAKKKMVVAMGNRGDVGNHGGSKPSGKRFSGCTLWLSRKLGCRIHKLFSGFGGGGAGGEGAVIKQGINFKLRPTATIFYFDHFLSSFTIYLEYYHYFITI